MKTTKNEQGFTAIEIIIVIVILIVIGTVGYFVAKHHNDTAAKKNSSSSSSATNSNTSSSGAAAYEVAVQKFITAMETNDKQAADGLQTTAFTKTIEQGTGSNDGSFFDSCKSAGAYCTGVFANGYLNNAIITPSNYTATNGTKGYQVDYTVKHNSGSSSADSNVVTFDTVQVNGKWLIDSFNENSNASIDVNSK